jgi:glycosyltransferase involved in cell wall biosynthesis
VITVLLSTRNGERTISRAIESVLAQTFRDFELLVVDNASTDGTRALAERYAARDARVRVVHEPVRGLAPARNRGLAEARHGWIALQDDDDVSHPERLEAVAAAVRRDPRLVVVGSWAVVWSEPEGLRAPFHHALTDFDLRLQMRRGPCPFIAASTLFRRDAAIAVGGFRDDFFYCDDYCLWARLQACGRLQNLPRHLVVYRHQDPATRPDVYARQREATARLMARYFKPLGTLERFWLRKRLERLRPLADARIPLDWPPELVHRYRLEDAFSRRLETPFPEACLTTA